MIYFLLSLFFALAPAPAAAQCNGTFANHQVCGNNTGATAVGRPIRLSCSDLSDSGSGCSGQAGSVLTIGSSAIVGGTSGYVLYNNAGVLGNLNIGAGVRELLSTSRTYYVRVSGNDTNCTGLTNADYSSGSFPQNCAFATLQKPYNVIAGNLDLGGQTVTVQIADGTYTSGLTVNSQWVGGGSVVYVGNTTTPTNVVISAGSASAFSFQAGYIGSFTIQAMRLSSLNNFVIDVNAPAYVFVKQADFAATNLYHALVRNPAAFLRFVGNWTISGGAAGSHWLAVEGGSIGAFGGSTVTVNNMPAWGAAYAVAAWRSLIDSSSVTFIDQNGHTRQPTTNAASPTGNTHSNTTLDGLSINTNVLSQGMAVSGTNIPAGTTIGACGAGGAGQTCGSGTSLTLSQAATGTTTGGIVAFDIATGQKCNGQTISAFITGTNDPGLFPGVGSCSGGQLTGGSVYQ